MGSRADNPLTPSSASINTLLNHSNSHTHPPPNSFFNAKIIIIATINMRFFSGENTKQNTSGIDEKVLWSDSWRKGGEHEGCRVKQRHMAWASSYNISAGWAAPAPSPSNLTHYFNSPPKIYKGNSAIWVKYPEEIHTKAGGEGEKEKSSLVWVWVWDKQPSTIIIRLPPPPLQPIDSYSIPKPFPPSN